MKRLNRLVLLSLVTPILIAAPTVLAAERMKSGQCEITTTAGARPAQCATPQEVKGINGTPAEVRAYIETTVKDLGTIQNFKVQGDTVSYTILAAGSSFDTRTSYHGDTFESVTTSKAAAGVPETSHIKGRRLGPCP